MRRINSILILFFSLLLIYTGFWFFVTNTFKKQLETEAGNLKKYGIDISYSAVTRYGFPLNIGFKYKDLILNDEHKGNKYTHPSFKVEANIIATKLMFDLGKTVHMATMGKQHEIECQKPRGIKLFSQKSLLFNKVPADFKEFWAIFKQATYKDESCTLKDVDNNKVIFESETSLVDLKRSYYDEKSVIDLLINIKGEDKGINNNFVLGKTEFVSDLNLILASDHDITDEKALYKEGDFYVKVIHFSTPEWKLSMNGALHSTKEIMMPTGEIEIKIEKYKELLKLIQLMHPDAKIETTKELLLKFSESKLDKTAPKDKVDLLFTVKRTEKESWLIGNMTIAEILSFLYQK